MRRDADAGVERDRTEQHGEAQYRQFDAEPLKDEAGERDGGKSAEEDAEV